MVFTLTHGVIALTIAFAVLLAITVYNTVRQNKAIREIREHANETRKRIIYVAAALPKTSREGSLGYHISMNDSEDTY